MNKIVILAVFLIASTSIAGNHTEGYFKYSRWCAGEVEKFNWDPEDLTCSTTLPGVMIVDTIMIPTFLYLDFVKFLSNPNASSQSSKGSSDNTHTQTPATSEKKKVENEVPEERKDIKNRLSLLQMAADDSFHFLATGETSPLLLATFKEVERYFVVTDPTADKNEAYAKALIRLNQMMIQHELSLSF